MASSLRFNTVEVCMGQVRQLSRAAPVFQSTSEDRWVSLRCALALLCYVVVAIGAVLGALGPLPDPSNGSGNPNAIPDPPASLYP